MHTKAFQQYRPLSSTSRYIFITFRKPHAFGFTGNGLILTELVLWFVEHQALDEQILTVPDIVVSLPSK